MINLQLKGETETQTGFTDLSLTKWYNSGQPKLKWERYQNNWSKHPTVWHAWIGAPGTGE